jgi:hypothetical protein
MGLDTALLMCIIRLSQQSPPQGSSRTAGEQAVLLRFKPDGRDTVILLGLEFNN